MKSRAVVNYSVVQEYMEIQGNGTLLGKIRQQVRPKVRRKHLLCPRHQVTAQGPVHEGSPRELMQ